MNNQMTPIEQAKLLESKMTPKEQVNLLIKEGTTFFELTENERFNTFLNHPITSFYAQKIVSRLAPLYDSFLVDCFEKIQSVFGEESTVYLSKDSTTCIHIRAADSVLLEDIVTFKETLGADEISYIHTFNMFKIVWK